jgi:hypothetical protein
MFFYPTLSYPPTLYPRWTRLWGPRLQATNSLSNERHAGILLSRTNPCTTRRGKSLDNPPPMGVGSHHPQPMKPDVLPPRTIQNRTNYPLRRFWTAVCYSNDGFVFFFFVISAESLKNHSKSQKNRKMENLILFDSIWVDLHSEYIIWNDLKHFLELWINYTKV